MGQVTEIDLEDRGLRGPLPASLTTISTLEILRLGNNQLTGTFPALSSWPNLRTLSIYKNLFTGDVPCATATVTSLSFSQNPWTSFAANGPGCLFTPSITSLSLSYLRVGDWALPPEIGNAIMLNTFSAIDSGLTGSLPLEMQCNVRLATLYAQRNKLTALPQIVFSGWRLLYRLDLSNNELSGSLPDAASHSELRKVNMADNLLTGDFLPFLQSMAPHQKRTVMSEVKFERNRFSGRVRDYA